MSQTEAPKGNPNLSPSSPLSPFRWAWVILLLGVAAVCVTMSFWSWYDTQHALAKVRAEVAEKVIHNDQLSRENAVRLNEIRTQLTDLAGRLVKVDEQNSDIQAQQATLESLYKGVIQQDGQRLLNDVEHLLMIASQELQLAGDVHSAIAALETADLMLSQSENQARFLSLRKAVSADLEALKAAPEIDFVGIAIKLEQLIHMADTLPLIVSGPSVSEVKVQSSPVKNMSFWRRFVADVWSELRQLVRVRYVDHPEAAMLSPEQAFFVRENLKLRLLAARVDALSRADTSFHQDLSASTTLIRQYFDTNDTRVVAALRLIAELQRHQLQIRLPSLNASYSALRQLSKVSSAPATSVKGAS